MADSPNPLLSTASIASFSCLTAHDIRKISVKRIVEPQAFDILNLPNDGGLYDPALGPQGKGEICKTCRLISFDCPGHFGHIDLPVPVFHPLFMNTLYTLLRGMCFHCHRFLSTRYEIVRTTAKLVLLDRGLNIEASKVDDFEPLRKTAANSSEEEETIKVKKSSLETPTEYRQRIFTWVNLVLDRYGRGTTRNDYKTTVCFDQRRKLIQDFLKNLRSKKCRSCGAYSPKLRKEGYVKFVERSLSTKEQSMHDAKNIKRKNVSELQAIAAKVKAAQIKSENVAQGEDKNITVANKEQQEEDESDDDDESENETSSDANDQRQNAEDLNLPPRKHSLEENSNSSNKKQRITERVMFPEECRAHIRLLFHNEAEILAHIFSPHGDQISAVRADSDLFFMEVVCVPPSRFRPASILGEQTFENNQTELLGKIVSLCRIVRSNNEALQAAQSKDNTDPSDDVNSQFYSRLLQSVFNVQIAVNSLLDTSKNPMVVRKGKLPPQGIKQVLEKKEGLFRSNMMGKRVNYAARSVISPDVFIETNEIGVPPVFAKRLTFPEPVTPHNVHRLMELVLNGPKKHPGANFIQMEDGRLQALDRLTDEERAAQANQLLNRVTVAQSARPDVGLPATNTAPLNKKVYRHLNDGDILILNRQPTLHKPSMMCHKARILKGEKTIRMHYANCNSYNADFDGDEMNMHFPQSYAAQAEARFIANTDNQYLVPTSGKPLRGLIQDHVVAGTWMTNKDTFFTRKEYQQLVYSALSTGALPSVKTLPPSILKPKSLWTGKQVISTILLSITPPSHAQLNLESKSKVPGKMWGENSTEDFVRFQDGEMLSGILDKSQLGASAYGLVHSVYELYGPECAGILLGTLSRLLTTYLQHIAFTCGMDDLKLTSKGNEWRRELATKSKSLGRKAAMKYVGMINDESDEIKNTSEELEKLNTHLSEVLLDDTMAAGLDASMSSAVQMLATDIISKTMPKGLLKPFPYNGMQAMTISGAKGSSVNASSISCQLGQQALEGRRVPVMISGKTLPSFLPFETDPKAGGYVAGRFLTGIRPQEYFFHCMAGREGLIDTAVKTARSGYLQRCLIKHLEGIQVHYDHTVRNSDSSIIQFFYGEDGLDVTKQSHLSQFDFAMKNFSILLERHRAELNYGKFEDKLASEHMLDVLDGNISDLPPAMSLYNPSHSVGSVSEHFARKLKQYVSENPQKMLKVKKKHRKNWPVYVPQNNLLQPDQFTLLMNVRYMQSLVEPGEAVGLLASQGVGEPSTQMTLNTFHFAGHGAANVTLGIPRLREIVMTASQDIKTPTMSLPIREEARISKKNAESSAKNLAKKMTRVTLSEVIDYIEVKERIIPKTHNTQRKKLYQVSVIFFPKRQYESEYSIKRENILDCLVHRFTQSVDNAIIAEQTKRSKEDRSQPADLGKGHKSTDLGRSGGDDDDDDEAIEKAVRHRDDEEVDGDADDAKRTSRSRQQSTYDDEAEESDKEEEKDNEEEDDDDDSSIEAAFASEQEEDDSDETASVDSDDEYMHSLEQAHHSRYITKINFDKKDGSYCNLELEFSATSHKLLLVGLLEKCAQRSVIREVPKISRCFVDDDETVITTEGSNLKAIWKMADDIVDLNVIKSNDIGAILRTYGVEAARQSIVNEIGSVFGVYGIGVDKRHLSLIADYMTSEGGYKPFNRTGLSNSPSPFLKASFETTANFVSEAALLGDFDNIKTPSSSIIMGQPSRTGTGAFELLASIV